MDTIKGKYSSFLSWLYILVMLVFSLWVTSCSPQKRIQRLADRHGVETKLEVTLDTIIDIDSLRFDTLISKELSFDTSRVIIDTTRLLLEDGTELVIIDQYISNERAAQPGKIRNKKGIVVFRPLKKINIKKKLDIDRIVVNPPDKIDVLLADMKWFVMLLFAFGFIVLVIRKLFK